jgi:phosphoribosylformimino-5-aminoimidazole carboxamide ribonucleotide (ProFAR) isomerase
MTCSPATEVRQLKRDTEQVRNRTITVYLELRGERKALSEWCEITGLKYKAIQRRLDRGWSVERALTEPAFVGKNQKFLGLEFHRAKKGTAA